MPESTTTSALEWLVVNGLLQPGALVGYDDFWVIPCNHYRVSKRVLSPLDSGEGKAHKEVSERHGLRWRCIAGPCKPPPSVHDCHANNNWAPIFLLQERGSSNPSSGFEFASADIEPWMAAFKVCDSLRDM